MHIIHVSITSVAALANGCAAVANFVGAEFVKAAAARVRVSQRWMIPFGVLLASGGLGLLVGLVLPAVGLAAAAGLVLYFSCALAAHLRVGDHGVGGAITFLVLAVAALLTSLAELDT